MPGRGKICARAVLIFTGCPSQDGCLLFERAAHAVAREKPVQPDRRNEQHHHDGRSDDDQNPAHVVPDYIRRRDPGSAIGLDDPLD